MSYELRIKTSAEKEMRSLPVDALRRVHRRVLRLAEEPYARGIKKLAGQGRFRARAGTYRILYTVDDAQQIVEVIAVRHRREAYR